MKNEIEKKDLFGICPYFTSQKVLSGKWALLILHHLDEQTLRFKELERKLAPITQATLTKQLRNLEEHGLITRTVYNTIPPKVEYSLTELGKSLSPIMEEMNRWGLEHLKQSNLNKQNNG